ncbi:hypothetical protein [Streptomyces sp. NBC_01408]|uniref:hypothetical protein n=1 Tax=Streptomyces sp. NBC_01408 TaxID=2903855 RepID=UPI00225AEFB2|nr:hypothetical protein [Streptomyces sp. NBC_01408]MCX4695967.1 hypothetical protein [Streptomyces sp. NBC_01408]
MTVLLAKVAWDHPQTVVGYRRLVIRRAMWVLSLGGPFLLCCACLYLGVLRQAAIFFLLLTIGFVTWIPWVVIAFVRRHRVAAVLRAYPWQDLPCRHPRRATNSPATIVIPFREDFTATLRIIPFPVDLVEVENDQPDRIWFAGDPRFGGVVSPVGGHYPVRVVPHTPRREERGGEGFELALRVGLVRRSGKGTRT